MIKTKEDFYIKASGEVLGEYLPLNWQDWEEETLNKWVEDHPCELYEYYSVNDLWIMIDSVSYALLDVYNEARKEALKENNDE